MILEIIKLRNKIRSVELSAHLNVSEDTIRRDLRELAEDGFIKKVHGGALANPKAPGSVHQAPGAISEEAKLIGQKAAGLVVEGQVILIDGGPASAHLVEQLPKDISLTVFTNGLATAEELAKLPNVDSFLLGGQLAGRARVTMGIDLLRTLSELHADLCFISASSLHAELGLTASKRDFALAQKAMAQASARTLVLCLSACIGQVQPFKALPIEALSQVITELEPTAAPLASLRGKGANLL